VCHRHEGIWGSVEVASSHLGQVLVWLRGWKEYNAMCGREPGFDSGSHEAKLFVAKRVLWFRILNMTGNGTVEELTYYILDNCYAPS
jgi:hypothetical protein